MEQRGCGARLGSRHNRSDNAAVAGCDWPAKLDRFPECRLNSARQYHDLGARQRSGRSCAGRAKAGAVAGRQCAGSTASAAACSEEAGGRSETAPDRTAAGIGSETCAAGRTGAGGRCRPVTQTLAAASRL